MSDKKQKIILAQIETQEVAQTEFSQFEIVNAVEASSPGGLNKKKLIYIGEGRQCKTVYRFNPAWQSYIRTITTW